MYRICQILDVSNIYRQSRSRGSGKILLAVQRYFSRSKRDTNLRFYQSKQHSTKYESEFPTPEYLHPSTKLHSAIEEARPCRSARKIIPRVRS